MKKVIIIAEAGVNHNGDMSVAKKLIDAAVEAKVDLVKFQTFKADKLASKSAEKAEYQKANTVGEVVSQFDMLKKLELSENQHEELINYARSRNVEFFSTAFDVEGLDYLDSLGFNMFKVPSGEITNYPYLKKLSELGKPVILSTGMANMDEINAAIRVLTSNDLTKSDLTILHCNTEYPTPMEDVNLKAMINISKEFAVQVGYSDHTLGIEVPIAAVAMGAQVIEKHFTLSRKMSGPDHKASLEPQELISMVRSIRNIELAISGDGIKSPSPSEMKNMSIARKSIHFSKNLNKGHIISANDIIALRPGNGVSPMYWNDLIGSTLKRDVFINNQFRKDDIL